MRSSGRIPTVSWTLCLLGAAWVAAGGYLPTPASGPFNPLQGATAEATGEGGPSLESILKELSSSDQQSALVAQQLLAKVRDGSPMHGQLLEQLLDPASVLESKERITAAERIVAAMGYQASTTSDALLAEGAEKLLDLLGLGPESLRRHVRAALLNHIRAELEKHGTSATFEQLGGRITHNSPPRHNVLRDAASILWDVDGKALLGFLIEGLSANRALLHGGPNERDRAAGYVLELRGRLRIDFDTVEGWEAWWKDQTDRSLEAILGEVRKLEDASRVELWRRNVQRVKESASPERYLAMLIDAFTVDPSLRLPVLAELSGFPVWLQETRFGTGALTDADREAHLLQGVRFLLAILSGERQFHIVALEVRSAAVAALTPFGVVIGRTEDLSSAVPEVLLRSLKNLRAATPEEGSSMAWSDEERRHALELLRALGALRVVNGGVREFLEGLLAEKALAAKEIERDPELSAEAVAAFGKLIARDSDPEAVEGAVKLFLDVYATAEGQTSKAWADLRRACVTAMNVPVEKEPLRDQVRRVYERVLDRPEGKPERIPAIIGLGILGKAGDGPSIAVLTDILRRRSEFAVGEVSAVVNALAYLGEVQALGCFLDFVVVKDQPFLDQIWKKVVSLLKGGKPELLPWLVLELERRGFERDSVEFYRATLRLAAEPGLDEAFASEKVNLEDPELLSRFWSLATARIRAHEIVGEEQQAAARLAELKAFIARDEKVTQSLLAADADLAELARAEKRLALKLDAVASLAQEPPPAAPAVVARFLAVLDEAAGSADDPRSPRSRWQALGWLRQRLALIESTALRQQIRAAAHAHLSRPEAQPLWEGLPATFREQYLKRLLGSGEG